MTTAAQLEQELRAAQAEAAQLKAQLAAKERSCLPPTLLARLSCCVKKPAALQQQQQQQRHPLTAESSPDAPRTRTFEQRRDSFEQRRDSEDESEDAHEALLEGTRAWRVG